MDAKMKGAQGVMKLASLRREAAGPARCRVAVQCRRAIAKSEDNMRMIEGTKNTTNPRAPLAEPGAVRTRLAMPVTAGTRNINEAPLKAEDDHHGPCRIHPRTPP